MDFVNRNRSLLLRRAGGHPDVIVPDILALMQQHPTGGLRRMLHGLGKRIRLQRQHCAVPSHHLVFVERLVGDSGNEDFPDAGGWMPAQCMLAPVPAIEVGNNSDSSR